MTIISLESLKQRVGNLASIDNALNEAGVKKRFNEENNKITQNDEVPFFVINPQSPMPIVGQKLYRVTSRFSGFQEADVFFYQHPPIEHTNQLRCNLPKNPVFYCSDVWLISLFEVIQGQDKIEDKIFYFSEWGVMVDRKWRVLSFIFSGVPQTNPAHSYIQQTKDVVVEKFKSQMPEQDITNYMDFYHAEFTREGSHKFSSIVSHQFLYDNGQKEGDLVFYPSVQARKLGNNYAFNKRVIDDGEIALCKVYKVHIKELTKTSDSGFDWDCSLVGTGMRSGDIINWNAPTQQDFDEFKKHFPGSPI